MLVSSQYTSPSARDKIGKTGYIPSEREELMFPSNTITMHVLPLEIQHTIFTLPCTDGGRTGLALSLTSKSYRDAVRPVRLHSVAVRAFPYIAGVLRYYKHDEAELAARRSTLKPRVRHLLLSPERKASYDIDPDEVDSEGSEAASDEEYIASLVTLLQLVGPTLTTLAYTAQFPFVTLVSVCPMPVLQECTLFQPLRERSTETLPGPPRPESPASYPALRKFHAIVSWGAAIPSLDGRPPDEHGCERRGRKRGRVGEVRDRCVGRLPAVTIDSAYPPGR